MFIRGWPCWNWEVMDEALAGAIVGMSVR